MLPRLECTEWQGRKIQRYAIWDFVLSLEIMITPAVARGVQQPWLISRNKQVGFTNLFLKFPFCFLLIRYIICTTKTQWCKRPSEVNYSQLCETIKSAAADSYARECAQVSQFWCLLFLLFVGKWILLISSCHIHFIFSTSTAWKLLKKLILKVFFWLEN